jgi:hypothetical protein
VHEELGKVVGQVELDELPPQRWPLPPPPAVPRDVRNMADPRRP